MKRIYLDHASITPIDLKVLEEMEKYSGKEYGNPSSIHEEGVRAKKAAEDARKAVGAALRAHGDEIIFTASGTEANNLAILGLFKNTVLHGGKKPQELHMITSQIEHPSVLACAEHLEEMGVKVDYIGVDREGMVNVKEIKEKLRPETFLVSIMYVNNEIGTIQPITEISKVLRNFRKAHGPIFFHVDACQAPLYWELNTLSLGIDLMTFDGQKMNGPRGVGVLYKKRGVEIDSIILGGGQEMGLRSGTENVANIRGFAKAFELAEKRREKDTEYVRDVRDYFISELRNKIFPKVSGATINGNLNDRIPNNVNISFPGVDNEFLLLSLDAKGIACSTKSSCLRDEEESYVVAALGKGNATAKSSLRFSLGRETTKKDVDHVIVALQEFFSHT